MLDYNCTSSSVLGCSHKDTWVRFSHYIHMVRVSENAMVWLKIIASSTHRCGYKDKSIQLFHNRVKLCQEILSFVDPTTKPPNLLQEFMCLNTMWTYHIKHLHCTVNNVHVSFCHFLLLLEMQQSYAVDSLVLPQCTTDTVNAKKRYLLTALTLKWPPLDQKYCDVE